VLRVKGVDRFQQQFARPAESLLLHIRQAPRRAAQIPRFERLSHPPSVHYATEAERAVAAAFEVIRSFVSVRALFRVPSLYGVHGRHFNPALVRSR
jgi:hypothetical protein